MASMQLKVISEISQIRGCISTLHDRALRTECSRWCSVVQPTQARPSYPPHDHMSLLLDLLVMLLLLCCFSFFFLRSGASFLRYDSRMPMAMRNVK